MGLRLREGDRKVDAAKADIVDFFDKLLANGCVDSRKLN